MKSLNRQRGGVAFVEKWTNARAAVIGFLTGRGYSSTAIAEKTGDDPATIRRMWALWDLEQFGHDGSNPLILVPLKPRDRAHLAFAAGRAGMTVEAYCEAVLVASLKR